MGFDVPDDRRYLASHEWASRDDAPDDHGNGTARVGISAFAQDELGDVVFVDLPTEGETVVHDRAFGVVESIKAVSDLYAPVSGTVLATNGALSDTPELVNEDPYGDGWLLELALDAESGFDDLLSADEYRDRIA